MVKPLSFKGDKKPKKRKRPATEGDGPDAESSSLVPAYASASASASVTAAENPDSDDSWVSADTTADVVGPVMFVLPTDPPSALATDAVGKVFCLELENMVDGNPATAEPHDVRQVWVANKVSGTEQFRFKGHHGKYLGCDKNGTLSAASDAVSPLECFHILPTADTPGTFQLQTLRDTFVTATPSTGSKAAHEVRGDADAVSFASSLRIRMQARFKPRLKASKEEKAKERISRKELEAAVGRKLEEDEVRRLKRARREGDYHEQLLMFKVKSKHDKFG
ncbi:hypothetical protein BN1723_017145 [Verticillium longisporum]|uniref:Actin-crosslinking protein n=1 Tax=Verticillium longisporum TaxID=100787 RepID=A0A0G4KNG1_VERLO|nr:Protein frg1 like protein [Verticillium longisporum]KAG7132790.1 Protein frg1 like protein [Verticillium longisporum]CRK05247.1 hypothetical protein BN1723_017145 [Verticillium longisporum]CRK10984.1 hypothetical protein BN1708_009995 [Verticillium longisporum]